MPNAIEVPWEAFPNRSPTSLFWRMGAGEDCLERWLAVIQKYDIEQLAQYLDEHAAPDAWRKTIELLLKVEH